MKQTVDRQSFALRLGSALTAAMDRFIPEQVQTGDIDDYRRARIIVAFTWAERSGLKARKGKGLLSGSRLSWKNKLRQK